MTDVEKAAEYLLKRANKKIEMLEILASILIVAILAILIVPRIF